MTEKTDYTHLVCPTFKFKTVCCFGIFKYISIDDLVTIIKNSDGKVSNSIANSNIDCIVLASDIYFRYTKKLTKLHHDIIYVYEYEQHRNQNFNKVMVMSEEQVLKICHVTPEKNIFPHYIGKHIFNPISNYVVVDIVSTGFDYNLDDIIKISAVKVLNDDIVDSLEVDIIGNHTNGRSITNIVRECKSNQHVLKCSLEEALIEYVKFIQDLPILSFNTLLKNNLLFYYYNSITLGCIMNDYIDIFQLVSNIYPQIKKVNLDSVSKKLKVKLDYLHLTPLELCASMHYAYQSIKNRLKFRDVSMFKFNNFRNKSFVFEGVFESLSRNDFHKEIEHLGGKVVDKVTPTIDYLVLSDIYYCNYINGVKTKKQVTVENFIINNSRVTIVSESTIKAMLYYHLIEDGFNNSIDSFVYLLSY